MKDIVGGTGNRGLEGLGLRKTQLFNRSNIKEQRNMIVKEIREKEEDKKKNSDCRARKSGSND